MRTPARLQAITTTEHLRVREALAHFSAAVEALDREQKHVVAPTYSQNMFGEAVAAAPVAVEKKRHYELDALIGQWGMFSRGLTLRMNRVRDELLPAVNEWHAGDDEAFGRALELLSAVQEGRAALEHKLAGIRTQVVFVEPLKPLLGAVTHALEQSDSAEDSEVFPAILTGSRETMKPEARRRSSSDVAKSLRTARPAEPEPEPAPGLFGRFKKLFGG